MSEKRILYCHCAYARVVPKKTKEAVLRELGDSGVAFDAVPDLCEMSARRAPELESLARGEEEIHIAACYPRAVKWLFHAAGSPLPEERVRIHNMRTEAPEAIASALLDEAEP